MAGQPAKTSYAGGQNTVDADGKVVGSTIGEQASRAPRNLATVLVSEGASLANIVHWSIAMVGVTRWMRVSPPSSRHGTWPAHRRPSRSTSSAASAPGSSWRSTPSLSCDGSRRRGSPLADRRHQGAGPEAGAPGTPGEPLGVRRSGDGELHQMQTFRVSHEDGAVRDGGPGAPGRRSPRRSEPAGQDGRDRTVLCQVPGCCIHSGCIRCKHDAAKGTRNRSDEARCPCRPIARLTHSAWLVNRSLPVGRRWGCAADGPRRSATAASPW